MAIDVERYRESIDYGPWVDRVKREVHVWVADRFEFWRWQSRRRGARTARVVRRPAS